MAAITSAVVGAVASIGSSAYQAYAASSAGGGGPGRDPYYRRGPQDPLDKAMRSYYQRANLANATKTYPSFGDFLTSGGDPSKAQFNLDMPALTPQEATAFGFTGPSGQPVPTVDYAGATSGDINKLSPEQIIYLAKERKRAAGLSNQPVGPWAQTVLNANRRLNRGQPLNPRQTRALNPE